MPTTPKSHSARQRPARQRQARREYDLTTRRTDPALRLAAKIRSSGRWQKVRAMQLAKQPLCQDPYGRHGPQTVSATEVDHRTPLRVAPELAFDMMNLASLCSPCHHIKSQRERRGMP